MDTAIQMYGMVGGYVLGAMDWSSVSKRYPDNLMWQLGARPWFAVLWPLVLLVLAWELHLKRRDGGGHQ